MKPSSPQAGKQTKAGIVLCGKLLSKIATYAQRQGHHSLQWLRQRASYHRIRLTNPRLIHGTYVTRRVTKPRTSVKGQPCMKTSQKESRAMAAVVNNTVATGGVCCPTPRLIVTMMPK